MSELGQWLRETRQAKELSLEQVEAETKIRAKFLALLEEDDYDKLPGETYSKGFLRNYALFLGLDPKEVLEKYKQKSITLQDDGPGLFRPLEVSLLRASGGRLRRRLLLLIAIVGLIAVGLLAWRTGWITWSPPLTLLRKASTATTPFPTDTPGQSIVELPTRPPRPSITATAPATATQLPSSTPRLTPTSGVLVDPTSTLPPTPTQTATSTAEPTPESTGAAPATTPSPTTMPGANVTLSIVISETNWVEVTVDSINVFRGLMEPGDKGTWGARREIILRLGNAAGAQVTVNGELLGTLGESQQVVEFAWGPEGEVTPEPTATPTIARSTGGGEIPLP